MDTSLRTIAKTYTLAEFWELPSPEDHSKLELIAGVLYVTPPSGGEHDRVRNQLERQIAEFIDSGFSGTLYSPCAGIWTSPDTYLQPDLFFISPECDWGFDRESPTTADLVIEVISPRSAKYDRGIKAEAYIRLGVKELWLVSEEGGEIEVRYVEGNNYGLSKKFSKGDLLKSNVLRGFELSV
jgi:Uma2 family endonuclease